MNTVVSLVEHFETLQDPRVERTRRHELVDIVAIAICAVICGAEGWEDLEEYGTANHDWLQSVLRLPGGIPSRDTFRRVLSRVNPDAFAECFVSWLTALSQVTSGRIIPIDGKTLRRSYDHADNKAALHIVSAWAADNHLVLGQQVVEDKSNEITAIPKLLQLLQLKGAIVTIDALGCQKDIATQIRAGGGDYVLAVKENQPTLYQAIQQAFAEHSGEQGVGGYQHQETHERNRGRQESRYYAQIPVPASVAEQGLWREARSIAQVMSLTQRPEGEVADVRYYISSLPLDIARIAEAVRSHWSIENQLHWVLDVTFAEDQSRIRKGHGAENFAAIRRCALSLLKRYQGDKRSIRRRRKRAGWDRDYFLEILNSMTEN